MGWCLYSVRDISLKLGNHTKRSCRYRIFPAFGLVEIPAMLSFEEAATLPCAALSSSTASQKRIASG